MATIPVNLENVTYGCSDGSIIKGAHRQIIDGVGATRQLVAEESDALCLLDSASGNIYTLPTPAVGMQFEFLQTVTLTSNASKIITSAATIFLLGEVLTYTTATASPAGFAANGTTILSVSMNGTTTGGVIGTRLIFTALSATQWAVVGHIVGSGTIATPFATS